MLREKEVYYIKPKHGQKMIQALKIATMHQNYPPYMYILCSFSVIPAYISATGLYSSVLKKMTLFLQT